MLKDIVERPSKAPSAPSAPQPSRSGSSGFPAAVHRSQRPSAFARSRKQQAAREEGARAPGEGKAVDVVPTLASSSTSASASTAVSRGQHDDQRSLSEADEVRRAVEADNFKRVETMSASEREEEVQELKERFGGGIAELMRRRKEAREKTSASVPSKSQATQSSEPGPSTPPQPQSLSQYRPEQTLNDALGDVHKILDQVSDENRQKVEAMSGVEREQEVEELQERFGPRIMDALRKRAEQRAGKGKDAGSESRLQPDQEREDKQYEQEGRRVRFSQDEKDGVNSAPAVSAASSKRSPGNRPDDPSLSDLKAYFPSVPSESSKLAWLQPLPTSSPSSASARFDLSGNVLSVSAQSELPQHLGLHHHGSKPDLAGYTIHDVLYLCRSTVPSQRITMMGVLAKIIVKLRAGVLGPDAKKECEDAEVVRRAIEMGVEILAGLTRGVGVIETGIDLLFEALGGPNWEWRQGTDALRFILDDEKVGVSAIPFEDVLPRMTELITIDDGLSSLTIQQLVLTLRRSTVISKDLCETICPILPTLIRQLVIQRAWPPTNISNHDRARHPSLDALRLMRDITASSRACAEELLGQSVYETTLRFVVTATWELEGLETALVRHGQSLALEVLQTYATLGRYGLSASIVTSSSEIWRLLGAWVDQVARRRSVTSLEKELVEAYFTCLGVWVTCAVDPHRTTPEHSLTWAQVSAMKWEEEAINSAKSLSDNEGRRAELSAVLEMLGLWVRGARVNGIKGGDGETVIVLEGLRQAKLGEVFCAALEGKAGEVDERLLAALVQQHDLLSPAGQLLDSSAIERLRQRSTGSGQGITADRRSAVYIRYHLLQLDVRSSSPATWIPQAFSIFRSFDIGDEPLALDLLDCILKSDLSGVVTGLEALSHPDKLQLLRPLLQYTILPEVESVVAPFQPSHLYLKASSTLRSPAARTSDEKPALPGLPLQPDWVFSPLNELLRSGTSDALAQTPPDWQATEVEIALSTLLLATLAYSDPQPRGLDRSRILLGLMKVHMLEHGQTTSNTANEVEVFRDPAVGEVMRSLMKLVTEPVEEMSNPAEQDEGQAGQVDRESAETQPSEPAPSSAEHAGATATAIASSSAPLEIVSKPFLGTGVPFYQFYLDFVALYEAISFADPLFSQLLIAPLSMVYPADYRKLVWNDHASALRGIRLGSGQIPLECAPGYGGRGGVTERIGDLEGLVTYLHPFEDDLEVLSAYARALTSGKVEEARNPFLYAIATHHLSALFWARARKDGESERWKTARKGLLGNILSTASDGVIRSILGWGWGSELADRAGDVTKSDEGEGKDEMSRRRGVVADLTGERGSKRIERL